MTRLATPRRGLRDWGEHAIRRQLADDALDIFTTRLAIVEHLGEFFVHEALGIARGLEQHRKPYFERTGRTV